MLLNVIDFLRLQFSLLVCHFNRDELPVVIGILIGIFNFIDAVVFGEVRRRVVLFGALMGAFIDMLGYCRT